ncbi:MAG TPA: ATP-binding protein [Gemmatimonadales bacterium]|nr:ATP-binding protein [Gemmatimonadales bacterium]
MTVRNPSIDLPIDRPAPALPSGGAMGRLIRQKDWSATPLGPIEDWPQSLRTAVGICTESRFPMAIWWGPDAVQLYNDGYVPVLGAKHPHSLGQNGRECWAEIWDVVGPLYTQVMVRGEATWSDDLLLPMDRYGYVEETYFTFSYSPIRDESGGVGGLLITCAETTARVVGERRLRTLRDLGARGGEARSVHEACELAAAILTQNPADVPFAALYLLEPGNALATLAGKAGLPEDSPFAPRTLQIVDGVPSQPPPPVPGTAETVVLPMAGSAREAPVGFLIAAVSPRRRLDDSYRGFFELVAGHIASAIAHARAYEEAQRRAEALAELDRAKTAFFGNVSHEFRTPLTLLLGPLEDALRDTAEPLGVRQRERLEVAHRNSLRLLRLVNTLLDVARLEAGRVDAAFEPVDLAALTSDLASGFRSAAQRAGLRFAVDCAPLAEPVYVDRDMWEKIVLNLLSNALKFTARGGIDVRLTSAPGLVHLDVRDTGAGIPADELPRIFERFHRVREPHGRSLEGTGIGLSLVQDLVKLHGGTIEVASIPAEGSTFRVTLQTGSGHLPSDQLRPRSRAAGAIGPAAYVEEALRWLPAEAPVSGRQGARIVLADDNADMREYVVRLLGEGWRVEAVADGRQALDAVRRERPDLVISDVMMPGLDGFALLAAIRADPDTRSVPVILLSARAGEESRVDGLRAGADDYLVKPFAARELLARIESMLTLARVRREAEAAVRASEERYRAFIELASDAVWRIEMEEPVPAALPADEQIDRFYRDAWLAECNDAMAHMYGFGSAAELVGARLGHLLPRDDPSNLEYLHAFIASGYRLADAESHEVGRDGRPRYFVNNLLGIVRDGALVRAWGSQRDITERRETMERLQRAQRMESVGKLAGGIAHEVNNMMSVVLGCSEFVLRRADLHPAVRADIEQVRQAAERSAAITAQLLAFSRRQMLQPVALDLGAVVRELEPVLRRTLGESVSLELRLGSVGAVLADRGQLQQVLVNLALNARDAMPLGGRLVVEIAGVELTDSDAAEHPEVRLRRGPHVLLRVTDTGHGMDRETAAHVFEPFFTTKGVGKGTGLGLSTVYGIVKQSDGYVWVDSEPGRGTTFRIYLPVVEAPLAPAAAAPARAAAGGGGTVLVVEDEMLVRTLSARVLEGEGYSVLLAEGGTEALALLERHADRVRLVLTDVAMAGISGRELGRRLAEIRPGLPVLFMSGYPADEAVRNGLLLEHQPFIQKPFVPAALAEAVRSLLDGGPGKRAQE